MPGPLPLRSVGPEPAMMSAAGAAGPLSGASRVPESVPLRSSVTSVSAADTAVTISGRARTAKQKRLIIDLLGFAVFWFRIERNAGCSLDGIRAWTGVAFVSIHGL